MFENDEETSAWQTGASVGYCIDCQPIMAEGKDANNFTQPGEEREFSTPSPSLDGNRSVLIAFSNKLHIHRIDKNK